MKPIKIHLILFLTLVAYAAIQLYCSSQLSLSYDESAFADYGATLLKGQGEKDVLKYDSKLPITALHMLPRAIEQYMHPNLSKQSNEEDIRRGRWITLLATLLLAWMVFIWSKRLYGNAGGIVSFFLTLLCPNFLAHGILVSSDIFACLFTLATAYFAWRWCLHNRPIDFILGAASVGFGLISKFSMVHLVLIFPGMILCNHIAYSKWTTWTARKAVLYICTYAGVLWLLLSAAHLFHGLFRPFHEYVFQSVPMQTIQNLLSGWSVPLPSSYVRSLDAVLYYDSLGGGVPGSLNGATYLLGEQSVHGFWYYYMVVLWYKLPIPTLFLLVTSIVFFIRNRSARRKFFFQNDVFLLFPLLYYVVYMSFFYATQVGIRHILMILPLLFVWMGALAQRMQPLFLRYGSYACLFFQLISVASWFPHFLPYTNEWLSDKKRVFRTLADTNICYGEGNRYLQSYLKDHPSAVYLPDTIRSGTVVMEVNEMLDLNIATKGKYSWARSLEPIDHLHSQYLIYHITPAMADSLNKRKR